MGAVTPKGLQVLLGGESLLRARINSYRPVTASGLTEVLGNEKIGRDPFSFQHRLKGGINGGPYGTNGDHIGRDLGNKTMPDTLDVEGPDPLKDRDFAGDEFQCMLMFDKAGKPAFESLWPEGTKPEDRVLNINIATTLPAYLSNPDSRSAMELHKTDALAGKPLEKTFTQVSPAVKQAFEAFGKAFEKQFGIRVDVRENHPSPTINVMSYRKGKRDIAAFASFPPSMASWKRLEHNSHPHSHIMINAEASAPMSETGIQQMVNQQIGLAMGITHPHDLALFRNLSDHQALTMTNQAYSDLQQAPLPGQEDGVTFGALDYSLRKWLGNAPALNGAAQNYDMDAAHKASLRRNKDTVTFKETGLLPTLPIFAESKDSSITASKGDDYIDTNTGYISHINHPSTGQKQDFMLMEGHVAHVHCLSGNNAVVACKDGNQHIHTGSGDTDVRIVYPLMTGDKTIDVQGEATLTLTASLLKSTPTLRASKSGNDFVLDSEKGDGNIRLEGQAAGKGISTLRMLSESGRVLFEKDVRGMSLDTFRAEVIEPAKQIARDYTPSRPDVPEDRPESWKERVERLRREADKAKQQGDAPQRG